MRPIRAATGAALSVVFGSISAASAQGQQDSLKAKVVEQQAVEIAALRYLRNDLGRILSGGLTGASGSPLLDLQPESTPQSQIKQRPPRPRGHAQTLASIVGAKLVDGNKELGCSNDWTTCSLHVGGPALIRVSKPAVLGDSARVRVTLLGATGDPTMPVSRRSWGLVLHRAGGVWSVVREATRMRVS